MDRVVFCPTDQDLDEAEKIAREYMLPIVRKGSPVLGNLVFDDSKVQFLLIPKDQFIKFQNTTVNAGDPIVCMYVDEFSDTDGVFMDIKQQDTLIRTISQFSPFSQPHVAGFRFTITTPGSYQCEIFDKDGLIGFEEIKVLL
ncbi:MAG: hypothetical protein O3A30_03975 [Bacteroidetes bacterium]|nr:hypothetical protein [Bacteroidota bacterium]